MPDLEFSLPSFAKINWMLRVLGRRADGFHEVFTVFQTISLFDRLSFARAADLRLDCNRAGIPTDKRNLVVRAATLLGERKETRVGARILLEKNIPSPGGLGGGSSDAAVALIGLNRLWEMNLPDDELLAIAVELGSDVPFFLSGGTAIGSGRGQIIEPVADLSEPFLLLVTPDIDVSTPAAFKRLGALNLTNDDLNRILPVCRSEAESLDPRRCVLKNDFEPSVFDAFPEIRRVKETLLGLGAVNAAMSGSGASVFAVFDNLETRQAAMKALDRESTWRKLVVATVSRAQYRGALGL